MSIATVRRDSDGEIVLTVETAAGMAEVGMPPFEALNLASELTKVVLGVGGRPGAEMPKTDV